MAPSNPQLNVNLAPAAIFTNRGFRNSEAYSRYLRSFCDRPLQPAFIIPPTTFNRYGLRVNGYINDLGWSSLLQNRILDQCPEAVRMFYASMQCGPGRYPSFFTTTVYNFSVTITADVLATLLHLPHDGYIAGTTEDFDSYGFHPIDTMSYLARDYGKHPFSMFSVERIPDELKALHFYITRLFLPRDAATASTLDESDLWIMFNAKTSCPISYAALMFNHMIKYREEECSGKLPFGPQITSLLSILGVDLRGKLFTREVHSDLQAQHIMRRTFSALGPQRLVNVQGGEQPAAADQTASDSEANHRAAMITVRLDKEKEKAESSGTRKRALDLGHLQEGSRLEKEGKRLLQDLKLSLKGKEAGSPSKKIKKVNKVLFVSSEEEESDPSEFVSSPEYTY
ncbi:unnamed protein product [Linum trigynum]|uniref:Uncharacterized protein n=1 Tax=Linum trigynum TaxID=586398 RepID=A0AAV2FEY9_9ROSI